MPQLEDGKQQTREESAVRGLGRYILCNRGVLLLFRPQERKEVSENATTNQRKFASQLDKHQFNLLPRPAHDPNLGQSGSECAVTYIFLLSQLRMDGRRYTEAY